MLRCWTINVMETPNMNPIKYTLLVALTCLTYTKPVAASVIPKDLVTSQQACIPEAQSYQDFLTESATELILARGKKPQKKFVMHFSKKLEAGFPQERFNYVKTSFDCVKLAYQVDGVNVEGFYLASKNRVEEKSPVVIFNRGGNGPYGQNTTLSILAGQLTLAKDGFIVLASNYREQDEFGGKDVKDVIRLIDIAEHLPQADIARLGMLGVSRGGHMTYLTAKQVPNVKSIAVWAGLSDLEQSLSERPEMERVFKARIPHYHSEKQTQLQARSVMYWLDELPKDLPILLLHGDKDKRVNVNQSIRLAKALEGKNAQVELKIFEGADHGLRPYREEALTTVADWFKKTL